MAQQNPFHLDLAEMMSSWMKLASDAWGQTSQDWKKTSRSQESLDSLLKTWRMMSSTVSQPESIQASLTGVGEIPAAMMRLAQVSLEGVTRMQQRAMDKMSQTTRSSPSFDFDGLDERFFDEWKTLYEQEIRKYFNIPQLGLTRFYQEKVNRAADRFQVLQTALAEFVYVLSKPFEASLKKLQDDLLEQSENQEWSVDTKEAYNRWIGILETEFMHLMKSPEYLKALQQILLAQSSFSAARDEIIQDLAGNLPFAGRKEMDELYKELYQLRKRVRELETQKKRNGN